MQSHTINQAPVSHRSALMIQPPADLWAPIQAIRAEYDSSYERWMPHINLLFGFIPEEFFPDAVQELAPFLADIPAFHATLEVFSVFEHRKNMTVWLRPDASIPGIFQDLYATVTAIFPQCHDPEKHGDHGFVPHLTVAKFSMSEKPKAMRLIQEWQSSWKPLTFAVNQVHLISRQDELPFEIRHSLDLAPQSHTKLS